MSRITAACVAALGLAGCTSLRALPAGPLGRPQPLALNEDVVTCELETSTGSHIARRVCRSQEERERDRDKAQSLLHRGLQQGIIVIH
jgi:hypothetical protein